MSLENKIVVITGAASGIGRATAKLLAQKKAKIVVSDINIDQAKQVVQEIKATGGDAFALEADVSNYENVQNLVAESIAHYGRLDVMVNNAGIAGKKMVKTAEHTLEDWNNVIAVNQTGVFYGMKVALKEMEKQGGGAIINVASLAGLKASGKNIAYSASKFAVVGMTKSAALEYASKNIRINAVCPSYTESALLDTVRDQLPGLAEKLIMMTPMRRFGEPEEIAEAICFLAGNQSSFITGQTITLDGGISL